MSGHRLWLCQKSKGQDLDIVWNSWVSGSRDHPQQGEASYTVSPSYHVLMSGWRLLGDDSVCVLTFVHKSTFILNQLSFKNSNKQLINLTAVKFTGSLWHRVSADVSAEVKLFSVPYNYGILLHQDIILVLVIRCRSRGPQNKLWTEFYQICLCFV